MSGVTREELCEEYGVRDEDLLLVGTWNAGAHGDSKDLEQALICDVLMGTEWGDREDLKRYARKRGHKVLDGNGKPGQSSTPLILRDRVKVTALAFLLALVRHYIGKGAGPDHNKTKWAVGARLRIRGRLRFGAAATHLVATQGQPLRHAAALKHMRRLARRFRFLLWLLGGDFNTTPRTDVAEVLYRANWTNNHREDGELPTHEHRAIDYVWWRVTRLFRRRLRFLAHLALATKSDHDLLIVVFVIRRRRGL